MISIRKGRLLPGLLYFACALAAHAGQQPPTARAGATDVTLTPEAWQKAIAEAAPLGPGCFQATYPSITPKQVPCAAAPASPDLLSMKEWAKGGEKVVGDTVGYFLLAPPGQTLSRVAGSFPSTKGVTSVSTFGQTGDLHSYSLQLNAAASVPPSICQGLGKDCRVWQQFVYITPDYSAPGDAVLFIGYWIIGADSCPSQFQTFGSYCIAGSQQMSVPRIPVTDLDKVQLWGFANPGAGDRLHLVYKDTTYILTTSTSPVRLGETWDSAEFNIFGNDGGGEAIFNPGSVMDVRLGGVFGWSYKVLPLCKDGSNAGTGETNNLVLVEGSCKGWSYPNPADVGSPYIQFTQKSDDDTTVWPSLTFSDPDGVVPGFERLEWTIQIRQSSSNQQWLWRWYQENDVGDQGAIGFDVQPIGQTPDTIEFSLGSRDSADTFNANSPACRNYGQAVICSVSYPWVLGRSYTFTAARTSQDAKQTIWTGTLTDSVTGTSTTIGAVSAPADWTLIKPSGKILARADPFQMPTPLNSCSDLPSMDAIISAPMGYPPDGPPLRMLGDSFVGNCTLYTPVSEWQSEFQIGGVAPFAN